MARFNLFGIPVSIDQGFVLGLVLFYLWTGGGRVGIFAAAGVGVFTLIHELGHAVTARRFGHRTAISLNFMVGWASYAGGHSNRRQEALISVMGPVTQLVAALPVLWIVRRGMVNAVNAADREQVELYYELWRAAIWAGVLLALLNLLPLWPLDGSHVLHRLIEPLVGRHSVRRIAQFTLVACGALLVGYAASESIGWIDSLRNEAINVPFPTEHPLGYLLWHEVRTLPGVLLSGPLFLILFCGIASWAALRAGDGALAGMGTMPIRERFEPGAGSRRSSAETNAHAAEAAGWAGSAPARYPAGWGPSPWLEAHLATEQGAHPAAVDALRRVTTAGGPRWLLPSPAEPKLAPLVARVPRPIVIDDPERTMVALEVLAHHGDPIEVAQLGSQVYARFSSPGALYTVAAGLARAGRTDEAMAWLRRAAHEMPDAERLGRDRNFTALHDRIDFQRLLAAVRAGQSVL